MQVRARHADDSDSSANQRPSFTSSVQLPAKSGKILSRIELALAFFKNQSLAAAPRRTPSCGWAAISLKASANWVALPGSHNQPLQPFPKISGKSPTRDATIGFAIAIASMSFAGI
jgi:hypothetical protein